MPYHVFDIHASEYDAWYDTEAGKAIFAMEVDSQAASSQLSLALPGNRRRIGAVCPGAGDRIRGRSGNGPAARGELQGSQDC